MSSEARQTQQPSPQQTTRQRETGASPSAISSPRRGEIWDVNWSPGRGAEQQGIRPALIIQNDRGNASPSYPLTIVASMSRTERINHDTLSLPRLTQRKNGSFPMNEDSISQWIGVVHDFF